MSHCPAFNSLPTKLTFEQASNPESDCFVGMVRPGMTLSPVVKRHLISAYNRKQRALEEEVQAQEDVLHALHFFRNEHQKLFLQIADPCNASEICNNDFDFKMIRCVHADQGLLSFLFRKLWEIEMECKLLIAATGQECTMFEPATQFIVACLNRTQDSYDDVGVDHSLDNDELCVDLMEELLSNDNEDALVPLCHSH